jgi:hypothetical protein
VGNLQRLAIELGWYFDEQSYVISRFPVLVAPNADGKYVLVEVERKLRLPEILPYLQSLKPLIAPGDYVLRLVKDDGDEVLAESSVFTVH